MWNPSLIDGPIAVAVREGASILLNGIMVVVSAAQALTMKQPGYHLNVAPSCMTAGMEQYRVEPATPERRFAGAPTVFMRFPDEAAARRLLAKFWIELGKN